MKPVKFLKRYKLYNVGEVAGFDEPEYSQIIKDGTAKALLENVEPKEPEGVLVNVSDTAMAIDSTGNEFEILRKSWAKLHPIITNITDGHYDYSESDLQQMIKFETENKNRASVKKGLQDEIIKRLTEKAQRN